MRKPIIVESGLCPVDVLDSGALLRDDARYL
jgi:hypothetical protein